MAVRQPSVNAGLRPAFGGCWRSPRATGQPFASDSINGQEWLVTCGKYRASFSVIAGFMWIHAATSTSTDPFHHERTGRLWHASPSEKRIHASMAA